MVVRRRVNTKTTARPLRSKHLDSLRWRATERTQQFTQLSRQSLHVPSRPDSLLYRRGWFGGNRESSGYTPTGVALILGDQKAVYSRGRLVWALLQAYGKRLYHIHLKRACEILRNLGNGSDVFHWKSECSILRQWTPNSLDQMAPDLLYDIQQWYATSITPLGFVGGPPGKCSIFKGTLLTLLLDRITVAVLLGGLRALDNIILPDDNYAIMP